jgi:hypothetical protein
MLVNETYTDYLLRTVRKADIWLSWWLRTTERMDGATMINGHVDASGVLVAPPPKMKSKSMLDSMFTLFAPFDAWLWTSIVVMIVCSGIIDWVLEYGAGDHGGKMKSSIYEYAAGVLWGGFPDPLSNLSAIWQVVNGLAIMVIVAAYTANLASFLTMRPEPSIAFGSVQDLQASRARVCSIGSYASQAKLEASFDLAWDDSKAGYSEIGMGLVDGQCDAAILSKVDYETMVTDGTMCELSTVGPSLYHEVGGWVTKLDNAACIQRSIEAALHELQALLAVN